jgi:hypothetical protein
MAQEAMNRFENLIGCSFDKGFYTPESKKTVLTFFVLWLDCAK